MSDRIAFRFWLVWNPARNEWPPSARHGDYATALKEAERLARNNQGQQFIVLEAVARACKVDVEVTDLRPPTEEMPF